MQATKSKPRLGRGLSSLISVSSLPIEEVAGPSPVSLALASVPSASGPSGPGGHAGDSRSLLIPIQAITVNPHQPRKSMSETAMAELAASIKSSGIIQPLVVRHSGHGFELIAGERRWRAAKIAGLAEVPVIIRDVDGFTQAQMALVENIQREDLNPIERAQGYRALMDQLGLTQAELAGRMGEDRSSVANFLRLLDLAPGVQPLVREGRLSMGHAKLIAGVSDPVQQQRLADIAVAQGLSVRNLERLLQDGPKAANGRKSASSTPHIVDLEKTLSRQLGLRVEVRSASKVKGRLVLHYSSLDQFDELLQKLGVSAE